MSRKKYMEKRQALLDEAQALLDEGKTTEANAKMEEIKALDESFQAQAEAAAELKALSEEPKGLQVQSLTDSTAPLVPTSSTDVVQMTGSLGNGEEGYASKLYQTAWAKTMQRKPLTTDEAAEYALVNETFTHTTENTGIVIPKHVAAGIWQEIGELYPYWNDISKTYVKGTLSMITGETSTEAGWYDEATSIEDAKETFGEIILNGCELARAITVSWKLQEMAMEEFIPYIQRRMAEKMGAALGYGVTHGKGQPGNEDNFKPEPLGIVTALEAQDGTPQIVTYKDGQLTYDDIVQIRAKIKGGYAAGLNIYANANTIWTQLTTIKDGMGRPILISDVINGAGVIRVLGNVVKEDDSMLDGEILFSNPSKGYIANVNKEMSMTTESHAKERTTDYCSYAIIDGTVMTYKAHALLKKEITTPTTPDETQTEDKKAGE